MLLSHPQKTIDNDSVTSFQTQRQGTRQDSETIHTLDGKLKKFVFERGVGESRELMTNSTQSLNEVVSNLVHDQDRTATNGHDMTLTKTM